MPHPTRDSVNCQPAAQFGRDVMGLEVDRSLLETQAGLAEVDGRIRQAAGDDRGAVAAFEQAVAVQDELPYLEPPYWYYPVRQSLGAALLRADRPAEAEEAFAAALERFPNNAWSLYGLMKAQQAQHHETAAAETAKRLEAALVGDIAELNLSRL